MRNFFFGLLVGTLLSANAAHALGITVEGIPIKSLVAAVLMAGTVNDKATAYALAEKLVAGK